MNKDLEELDKKIISLLNQRTRLFLEDLKNRDSAGTQIYSPCDRIDIAELLELSNNGPISDDIFKEIYNELISYSIALLSPVKVVYLGPRGTFSYSALLAIFGGSVESLPQSTIPSVFEEVESGRVHFGVVPVENSTEGSVTYTLDEFMETDLKIVSEKYLRINNSLLSMADSIHKIKKVYAHPQSIAQCKIWLKRNLPDAEYVQVSSTIAASESASREIMSAAIASEVAAKIYNLNTIASNIEDYTNNYTRFFVLGYKENIPTGNDKTSLVVGIRDEPGALFRVLKSFRDSDINLSKIESRPNKKEAWAYNFFIDIIGHVKDTNVLKALDRLRKDALFVKILGSYPVNI
jgi:chorismate mutase / prephenate dehydratase